MFRAIYKFLASLQFAVTLMVVLILASIVGTILETQISADIAQKWIYNNWLFNIWLSMLCVNLFCVASIRYPWKPHQTGFVITHAGIITLLIGSMIDRIWGIEGFMHLHSNRPGTNVMELREQVFTATLDGQTAETNFKVSTLAPRQFKSPDPNVKVEVVDILPVSRGLIAAPVPKGTVGAAPAINYTLQGAMMGRNAGVIFFNETDDLLRGIASVRFLAGAPPEAQVIAPRTERFFVFHKEDYPVMNATHHGEPTGAKPKLVARGGAGSGFDLQLEFQGKTFTFPLKYKEEAEYPLEGLPDWRIRIRGYYPNFVMRGAVPDNIDENPLNPAAVFELVGPLVKGAAVVKDDPITAPNGIAFYLGADGVLRYLLKSRAKGGAGALHGGHGDDEPRAASTYKSGEVKFETPIPVNWAPGAECVVHEMMESALQKVVHKPRPELKGLENVTFGLECRVTVGTESKNMWVGQTEVGEVLSQEMEVGGKKINLGFVNRSVILPFSVALKKFSAPTDEGSVEFAAFESTITFNNAVDTLWLNSECETAKALGTVLTGAIVSQTPEAVEFVMGPKREGWIARKDIVRMEKQTHKISMNRPTTYPPSFVGPFLGFNHKFSQANHRIIPGDPKSSDYTYSGVQVLRDPGWFLKWFGCIMIVFGIYTMFYLRPYFNRASGAAVAAAKGKGKKEAEVVEPAKLRFFEHPLAVIPLILLVWPLGIHLLVASRAFKPAVKIAIFSVSLVGLLYAVTQLY